MFNQLRLLLTLGIMLPLGLVFLLTSCIYSAKYIATYTVQDNNEENNTKEITVKFINQLADKHSLNKDTKYNGIDTLGFYGQPYHYFKFWFEKQDSNTLLKLDYWGNSGNRKSKPYQDFFNELNDFMKENFIIVDQVIQEDNNSKKSKH